MATFLSASSSSVIDDASSSVGLHFSGGQEEFGIDDGDDENIFLSASSIPSTFSSFRPNTANKNDDNDNNNNVDDYANLKKYDHNNISVKASSSFDLYKEASSLIHLTLPSVLVQLCLYMIFPQAASVVGRSFGSQALGGFSLGSLVGNLTCLSIMVGALTAADTLFPRAYAAAKNNKNNHHRHHNVDNELGILLLQSILTCSMLLIFPVLLLCKADIMKHVLIQWFQQDPIASTLAVQWIQVYLWGVPANVVFRILQRFLVAQHHPWPPVFCAAIPCFVLQPILLSILTKTTDTTNDATIADMTMGFLGSAWAIVITQWSITILLLLQTTIWPPQQEQQHASTSTTTSTSWLKIITKKRNWIQALECKSLYRYINLSLGGVLSLSEWWFWETMCFVAGSFGVEALCAHTIAYNMIPLLYMIPLGFSIGLTVRMGHTLATPGQVSTTIQIAAWCMGCIVVLGIFVGCCLYKFRDDIIGLFITTQQHPIVFAKTQQIWPMVSIYIVILYIFGINGAILKGLGMQWRLATIIFGILWCGLLPAVFYFAVYQCGGLIMEWKLLPTFYSLMQLCLIWSYAKVDWYEIGHYAVLVQQQQQQSSKRRKGRTSHRSNRRSSSRSLTAANADTILLRGSNASTTTITENGKTKSNLINTTNNYNNSENDTITAPKEETPLMKSL